MVVENTYGSWFPQTCTHIIYLIYELLHFLKTWFYSRILEFYVLCLEPSHFNSLISSTTYIVIGLNFDYRVKFSL